MDGKPPLRKLFGRAKTESTRVNEDGQEYLYGTIGQTWMSRLTRGREGIAANPEKTAYETFSDMADDAGIAFPLNIIKWLTIRTPWDLICTDNEIKVFILKNLNNIWRPLIRACTHAFKYGWVGMEKRFRYNERDGKWYYNRFLDLRPHGNQLRIVVAKDGSFNGLIQYSVDGKDVFIPKEKSFVYTYDKEFGNLYGRSMLRAAFRYWYSDRYFYDYQAIYAESRAISPLIMRAPLGKTKRGVDGAGNDILVDNLDLAQEIGESIRNATVVTLPSAPTGTQGVEQWKADPLTTEGEKFPFNESHAHFDKMKARGMGVPDELSQGGSGSLAKAKEQGSFFLLQVEGILEDIADHALQYIILPLVQLNFAEDRIENTDIFFKFKSLRDDDKQFALSVMEKAREKFAPAIDIKPILETANIPVSEEYLITSARALEKLKKAGRTGEETTEEKPAFGGLGGIGGGLKPATPVTPKAEEKPDESFGGRLKEISAPLTVGGEETEAPSETATATVAVPEVAPLEIRIPSNGRIKLGNNGHSKNSITYASSLNSIQRSASSDLDLFWKSESAVVKSYLVALGANIDAAKRIRNESLFSSDKYIEFFKSYAFEAFEAGIRDTAQQNRVDNNSIIGKISSVEYSLLDKKSENHCSSFVNNIEKEVKETAIDSGKVALESADYCIILESKLEETFKRNKVNMQTLLKSCYEQGKNLVNKLY